MKELKSAARRVLWHTGDVGQRAKLAKAIASGRKAEILTAIHQAASSVSLSKTLKFLRENIGPLRSKGSVNRTTCSVSLLSATAERR